MHVTQFNTTSSGSGNWFNSLLGRKIRVRAPPYRRSAWIYTPEVYHGSPEHLFPLEKAILIWKPSFSGSILNFQFFFQLVMTSTLIWALQRSWTRSSHHLFSPSKLFPIETMLPEVFRTDARPEGLLFGKANTCSGATEGLLKPLPTTDIYIYINTYTHTYIYTYIYII